MKRIDVPVVFAAVLAGLLGTTSTSVAATSPARTKPSVAVRAPRTTTVGTAARFALVLRGRRPDRVTVAFGDGRRLTVAPRRTTFSHVYAKAGTFRVVVAARYGP